MIENVSQIMSDKDNQISDQNMNDDDIDDEIEIIDTEEIEGLDSSGDELPEDKEEATTAVDADDSTLIFNGHSKAVLCCAISSDKRYAVSGGEDDKAFVWRTSDSTVVFECGGHKDSVIGVAFNSNDSLIASADMSGQIYVWDISGTKLFDFEVDDINWILWHPIAPNILMAGTAAGDAWMWKLNSSSETNDCKTFQSFGKPNSTAKCLRDGKRIAMGYEDGVIKLWDLKTASVIHSIHDFNGHNGTVTSLDCSFDNALIGSGSVDSTAKLINCQTGRVVATFQCSTSDGEEETDSVESVGFSPLNSMFATATVDGSVDIWDVSTQVKRQSCKHDGGISKILWDINSPHLLYTAGLDGFLAIFDARNGQMIDTKKGHSDHILDFCVSRDSTLALTASEDQSCRIFSLEV